jgi:hypothetical protein
MFKKFRKAIVTLMLVVVSTAVSAASESYFTLSQSPPPAAKHAELRIVVDGKIVSEYLEPLEANQINLSRFEKLADQLISNEPSFAGGTLEIVIKDTMIDSVPLTELDAQIVPKTIVKLLPEIPVSQNNFAVQTSTSSPSCEAYCGRERRECMADCAGTNCSASCGTRYENCLTYCNQGFGDEDGDGLGDSVDNCPVHFNPGQENCDLDNKGDVCDALDGTYVVQQAQRCFVEDRSRLVSVGWGNWSVGYLRVNVRDFWDHHLVDVSACHSPDLFRRVQYGLVQNECYEVNGIGCHNAVRHACEELVNASPDQDHSWCGSRFDENHCVGVDPSDLN